MRQPRRTDRGLSQDETAQLLEQGEYGILATVDDQGQPYGTPTSYAYRDGCIYCHCALSGHKLDNLATNPRICFSVVGRTELLPAEFATRVTKTTIDQLSGKARR